MSLYRGLFIVVAILCVAMFSTGAFAAVPLVTSYQGRLLDASDQPLTGSYTMVFQIFEVPVGGAPLWTEDHVGVQVADGLFTVALGSTVPLSADLLTGGGGAVRYLQIQIAGQPAISPRTRLSAAPYSVASGSVSGDIQTSPGRVVAGDLDGDGFLDISSSSDQSELHLARKRPGKVKYSNLVLRVMPDSLSDYRDTDSDDDGVPETEFSQRLTPTTSSVAIKTKGTGASNAKTASLSAISSIPFAGGASASLACTVDDDGDGVPETSVSSSADASSAKHAINTKGTGGTRVIRGNTDSLIAESSVAADLDGDGLEDNVVSSGADASSARLAINSKGTSAKREIKASTDSDSATILMTDDVNGDGIPESEISQSVTPTTSGVAIKTKGTGADPNRVVSVSTNTYPFAASDVCAIDDDGDGVSESEISHSVTPTTSSVAIKVKGTGADKDRVISSTTDTAKAVTVHSADIDGDGVADRVIREQCDDDDASITVARGSGEIKIKHKGWDGTIKGRMAIEEGGAIQVDFAGDGVGFVSQRFGVGVLSPTHPFEHSSGAHLTAGGVWTNASDENLKENFQPVDGQELLEKIAELPISQWNYKSESDEVRHIGPTAQDFQTVFGVGENDRTISTIDPSGIALAAIKALRVESKNKSQQLNELQNKVQQLEALVEKLLSEKK